MPAHGDGHVHEHNHGGAGAVNDPNAPPATAIPGADVVRGEFKPLPDAPSAARGLRGAVCLARQADGTTVTITLPGMSPGQKYMSHLHAEPCSRGGGEHFRFDPEGPPQPPNEVHLGVTADTNGSVTTTVRNPHSGTSGVASTVVHDESGTKMVCADL